MVSEGPGAISSSIDSSPRSTVLPQASAASRSKNSAIMSEESAPDGSAQGAEAPAVASEPQPAEDGRLSPSQTASNAYYAPQQASNYYAEPPSPRVTVYDGSFFQTAAGAFHSSAFAGNNTPLSPPRPTMGVIPPASPLFPRVAVMDNGQPPPSPSLPYMSTTLPNMYYGSASSNSPDEVGAWNDRNQNQNGYQQNSPQIQMSYNMALSRSGMGGRAYSFEDAMLPPSALDPQDHTGNPAYSPYSTSQSSPIPGTGGTLFAQQAGWGYASGPLDMYSSQGSPLQPRPSAQMSMYGGIMGQAAMRQQTAGAAGGGYGQFYPASSPGPPIQTTASNKGPEGANLFIFHIPNHFTNLDMYQLFCPYGNLLSVRIMVEKDSGRSRGFGFVSYDSPEAAALAIKELNGFAVGNKRLKVQHKQIRPKDLHNDRDDEDGVYGIPPVGAGTSASQFHTLPPSGASANQNLRYDGRSAQETDEGLNEGNPDDGAAELTNQASVTTTATAAEPSLVYGTTESGLANMGSLQNALPEITGTGSGPE